ncbi:MAG: hypothetical protein WBM84_02375 [Sedimenticolaceae bacterium]
MKDLLPLLLHLLTTIAKLLGPGGIKAVVADSLLMKQQLLVINRARSRAPNLSTLGRCLFGFCALFLDPRRIRRAAVVIRPSTLLKFHCLLKQRNSRFGCPRIAQQINRAFGVNIDNDVVRRILATYYRPGSGHSGPSWLSFLGKFEGQPLEH